MSLEKQAVSGVRWMGISAATVTSLRFVEFAVVAHLLDPKDFGLMVMITVAISFAEPFADMGVSNAIIHHQDSSRKQLSSLYWLNIFASVAVFCLVIASIPMIEAFYTQPRLRALVPWAALYFLVTPVGQQFQVLLQKELKFFELGKVEMISAAIGTMVAILSAVAAQGVFSLIWGQLAVASSRSALLLKSGWNVWRPDLHFRWDEVKDYFVFGLYQMGERSLNVLSANVDYLVIGRFLGPQELGIYVLAYLLVTIPHTRINPILTRVAFPVFSRKQTDDRALRRGYVEMIRLLAYVVFPLLIGIAAVAPVFVPVVFGAEWTAAVPLIRILALVGMIKALMNPSGSILLAKGRPDIGFRWTVLSVVLNGSIFWSVASYGVSAVAWAYMMLSIVHFGIGWLILRHVIELGCREYTAVLQRPLAFSILMGTTMFVGYSLLSGFEVNRLVILMFLLILGTSVYGSVAFFERDYFRELRALLLNKRRTTV